MAANDMGTLETRASEATVLTWFFQNILTSAPEELIIT